MNCELCGSNIRGEPQAVNIDGGIFRVCNSCSHLGTPARLPGKTAQPLFHAESHASSRLSPPPPRPAAKISPPSSNYGEQEMELATDYPKIIKDARELLKLTQEQVGMKINEKPSVIHHLENGSMKPSDALAKKLEHFLKVQLFIPVEEMEGEGTPRT